MVLVQMNVGGFPAELTEQHELFLIAAFNKCPAEITAENLTRREYRPWLLKITDELNHVAPSSSILDCLDVLTELAKLRKQGRLRNRSKHATPSVNGD